MPDTILTVREPIVTLTAQEQVVSLHLTRDIVTLTAQEQVVSLLVQCGPPGPPGQSGAPSFVATAGAALSALRLVTVDSAGRIIYADSGTPAHADRILGLTMTAAVLGEDVAVLESGAYSDPSWTWDPLLPIWLGSAGHLTQTPPTSGVSQIVAAPVSSTKIVLLPREAFRL